MYSPRNVDQTFILIIYPNNIFVLLETATLEKEQPMYMGKDRIKVEGMLKEIKKKADLTLAKNSNLKVYDVKNNELKLSKQSPFYRCLPLE
jgi:hypothetical protein